MTAQAVVVCCTHYTDKLTEYFLISVVHSDTHTHTHTHTHLCTQRTPVLGMFIQGRPCAALSDKGAVKSTVDSGSAGEHVSRCLFNNLFTVNTLTASLTPFTPYLQRPLAVSPPTDSSLGLQVKIRKNMKKSIAHYQWKFRTRSTMIVKKTYVKSYA